MEIASNLREVLASLGRFEAAGSDLSPLMRIWRGMLADSVEENFERQGRPAWLALSKRTIAARTKRGTWPGKILQERGELAASVVDGSDRNSAWVSTNKAYAKIHQYGGTIKRPARSGTVRLRTDRRGNLLRQGPGGSLAIFARNRHKQARSVAFEGGAYTITIPARPYFLVPRSEQSEMELAAHKWMAAQWAK